MVEFVNPNNPPEIDGETVISDPKWIDGGIVNPSPEFDVDDPTMWLPLTVLSGLASGYCERRAVVSSSFKFAAGGSASTTINWYEATEAQKASIVSACANNMALGKNLTSIFYSSGADANGQIIGSVGAAGTYMQSMDSAINGLIYGGSAASVFCKEDGQRYSTVGSSAAFNALASAAKTRADSYGTTSGISQPILNGGTQLRYTGYPALPVEWAKERKWMLDELKYVGTAASPVLSIQELYHDGVRFDDLYAANNDDLTALYSSSVENGTAYTEHTGYKPLIFSAWGYGGKRNSQYISGSAAVTISPIVSAPLDVVNYKNEVTMYFGFIAENNVDDDDRFTYDAADMEHVTANVTAVAAGSYVVHNGGVLTIPTNITCGTVIVESGGTLMISGKCSVLDLIDGSIIVPGVTAEGYVLSTAKAVKIYRNHKPDDSYENPLSSAASLQAANWKYVDQSDTITLADGLSYFWVNNATLTLNRASDNTSDAYPAIFAISGATVTVNGNNHVNVSALASAGGRINIYNNARAIYTAAYSGGIIQVSGTQQAIQDDSTHGYETIVHAGFQHLYSGGSLLLAGNSCSLEETNWFIESGGYWDLDSSLALKKYEINSNCYIATQQQSATGAVTHGLGPVVYYQFNNFGLVYNTGVSGATVTIQEGWNTIPVPQFEDDVPVQIIFSGAEPAVITPVSDCILGTLNVDGSSYMPYTIVHSHGAFHTRQTAYVRAINSAGGGVQSYYNSFRVRQFYNDPGPLVVTSSNNQ